MIHAKGTIWPNSKKKKSYTQNEKTKTEKNTLKKGSRMVQKKTNVKMNKRSCSSNVFTFIMNFHDSFLKPAIQILYEAIF